MNKIILLGLILFLTKPSFSQALLADNDKLASLCKIWGFLKYYHPYVAKGKLDWDKELVDHLKIVANAKDKQELSKIYTDWLQTLGMVKPCKKCSTDNIPDSLKRNLNLDWLNDQNLFTNELINSLHYIEQNRNQKRNYYASQYPVGCVNLSHEKKYKQFAYPSVEYRLLSLYRYWNTIHYYYPYKYAIGEDWNKVLVDMIPKFRDAKDTIAYHLAMAELVARINDSHASLMTLPLNKHFSYKYPAFKYKIIDSKAIITGSFNDSLSKIDEFQYGDVILKINDTSLSNIITDISKYVGASNLPTKIRNMEFYYLFTGKTDTFKITFERNGVVSSKIIHRYGFWKFNYKWPKDDKKPWKILDGNVGYINLGSLKSKEVNKAMKSLLSTDALILDIRNYPMFGMYKISKYLNNEKKPFVKFTLPLMRYPGVLRNESAEYCGRTNRKYYKGHVVVLINEQTQSAAEFACMMLKTAPKVTFIGSQTAGADGNVSEITFPGGYKTFFFRYRGILP